MFKVDDVIRGKTYGNKTIMYEIDKIGHRWDSKIWTTLHTHRLKYDSRRKEYISFGLPRYLHYKKETGKILGFRNWTNLGKLR